MSSKHPAEVRMFRVKESWDVSVFPLELRTCVRSAICGGFPGHRGVIVGCDMFYIPHRLSGAMFDMGNVIIRSPRPAL